MKKNDKDYKDLQKELDKLALHIVKKIRSPVVHGVRETETHIIFTMKIQKDKDEK